MELIKNRSELLFLYDVRDTNPNGDPVDENKPRIDEETGINLVTDVRLKRTIRDYWKNFKQQEIFIQEIEYEPGKIQDAKMRGLDFYLDETGQKITKKMSDSPTLIKDTIIKNVLEKCLDVRLFGVTMPLDKDSITFTGPVQFKMGRSLHRVNLEYIKGTGAFAAAEGKGQKTFREEYFLSYSLIGFYGIINENAATMQKMNVTENDISLLLEGIWNGTKNLISRSKVGQNPRLLLRIVYNEQNYHMGELDKMVKVQSQKTEEEIRSYDDYVLDVTNLVESLRLNGPKIHHIEYVVDPNIKFISHEKDIFFKDIVNSYNPKILNF